MTSGALYRAGPGRRFTMHVDPRNYQLTYYQLLN